MIKISHRLQFKEIEYNLDLRKTRMHKVNSKLLKNGTARIIVTGGFV